MLAGSALAGADTYAQGMAANGYQQSLSNYMQMAGMGQTAAGQTNSAAMNAGNMISGNAMNLGAGMTAAYGAQGNNLTSMLNNGTNQYMNYTNMQSLLGAGGNGLGGMSAQTGVPGSGVLMSSQNPFGGGYGASTDLGIG